LKNLIAMSLGLAIAVIVVAASPVFAAGINPAAEKTVAYGVTAADSSAAGIENVIASVGSNKTVSITGNISSGESQQIIVRITDPNGKLNYFNSAVSTTGGDFSFSYKMADTAAMGVYNVSIGTAGIANPYTTTFNYGKNADLNSLSLNGCTLDQPFSSDTTSYTASVGCNISSITVTPTLSDPNASVTVNGSSTASGQVSAPISLNYGSNTINVAVTALDGITTKTYTITVTRAYVAIAAVASVGSNKSVSITGNISSGESQQIIVRITDPNGELNYFNSAVSTTGGDFSFSYTLTDDAVKGRYNVSIGGVGVSSPATTYFYYGHDADLDNLTISSGTFSQPFAYSTTNYTTSVNSGVSNVTVTPTLDDSTATVSVNDVSVSSGQASGLINLNYGSNTINVVVTTQDRTTSKTYTISVYRYAPTPPTPPSSPPAM